MHTLGKFSLVELPNHSYIIISNIIFQEQPFPLAIIDIDKKNLPCYHYRVSIGK